MIVALIMGRAGSVGVKRKNLTPICGEPLCTYPMRAALQATRLNQIFVTTDCPEIKRIAIDYGLSVIDRPEELAHATAEMSEGIVHADDVIRREYGISPSIMVTMHANSGIHKSGLIDECIEKLESDPAADSCVSARRIMDLHPYRQKRVNASGYLETWIPVPDEVANNRQMISDVSVVLDGACRAIRVDRCLPPVGQPPFRYLGNTIAWVDNPHGLDVHSENDILAIEHFWSVQNPYFRAAIS